MCGIFIFLFHLLHQKIFPNFCFFKVSWIRKSSEKLYFLQMYDDNNRRTIIWFLPISWLKKTLWRKKISPFFGFKKCLKKRIFVNFLLQKFITKYGIVSTYSVTFESQKNFTWLQCDHLPSALTTSGWTPASSNSAVPLIWNEWPVNLESPCECQTELHKR